MLKMSKPNVWVHGTEDQVGRNGWRTDFMGMATEHFNLITATEIDENEKMASDIEGALLIDLPRLLKQLPLMPKLRAAANHGVGYNHIDVKGFAEKGIAVSNTPDVLSPGVADMGMALLLASARNIYQGVNKAMGSDPPEFMLNDLGVEVNEKTLGIVGMGSIGLRLAKRARAFDMQILYHNRSRRETEEKEIDATYYSSLHEMLPLCDFIIIIVPLTPQTDKLFGETEFRLMKNSATIINIARGQVIDQDALVVALRERWIRAAALDVTYPEPLPRDHPLLSAENLIITPHYGSATTETRRKMCQCMVDNLKAVLIDGKDRMPNQVN